jgi:hypothetical protein
LFTLIIINTLLLLLTLGAIKNMSQKFEDEVAALSASVARLTAVEDGAIALIQGLAAQVSANINDPVALDAIVQTVNAQADRLAAAVAANTPADATAPAPATDPAPAPVVDSTAADNSGLDAGSTSVG